MLMIYFWSKSGIGNSHARSWSFKRQFAVGGSGEGLSPWRHPLLRSRRIGEDILKRKNTRISNAVTRDCKPCSERGNRWIMHLQIRWWMEMWWCPDNSRLVILTSINLCFLHIHQHDDRKKGCGTGCERILTWSLLNDPFLNRLETNALPLNL